MGLKTRTVQPAGLSGAQEELRSVGVGSSVGHGQSSRSGVLQGEVLILELVSVDGFASGTVSTGEVTSLAHESWDNPVEARSSETESFLSSAQSSEVLGGLRDNIVPESHYDSTGGGTTNADVKENLHGVERELERGNEVSWGDGDTEKIGKRACLLIGGTR